MAKWNSNVRISAPTKYYLNSFSLSKFKWNWDRVWFLLAGFVRWVLQHISWPWGELKATQATGEFWLRPHLISIHWSVVLSERCMNLEDWEERINAKGSGPYSPNWFSIWFAWVPWSRFEFSAILWKKQQVSYLHMIAAAAAAAPIFLPIIKGLFFLLTNPPTQVGVRRKSTRYCSIQISVNPKYKIGTGFFLEKVVPHAGFVFRDVLCLFAWQSIFNKKRRM